MKKVPKKKVAVKKVVAPASVTGLEPRQQRFVEEYLVDLNGTQAAIRAGYSAKTARAMGTENLSKPAIASAVRAAMAKLSAKTDISAERVVREAWNTLTADPREFMEYRVGCCRHCWGKGFLRQRTDGEFETAREANALANRTLDEKRKPGPFEVQGGSGFDLKRDANPQCPDCGGEGRGRTVFKDTRNVSPAALSLFAGIKETKEGLEIKLHDKGAAMDKLFRHFGIYNDKLTITLPTVTVKDMTGKKGPAPE